ncbi:hypothetical protein ACI3L1_19910, partial [Deinococcus sp. SM5_A1]
YTVFLSSRLQLAHLVAIGMDRETGVTSTGARIEVVFVSQGYTCKTAASDAARMGVELMVKRPEGKGLPLTSNRWVVERSFA